MKRTIIFTVMLVLLASSACASDLDIMVEGHNLKRVICGAAELKNPEVEKGSYTYKATENVHVIFTVRDDLANSCSCVCLDEADAAEFLAQCVTICYNYGGTEAGTQCYDPILFSFMQARAGIETDKVILPGIMFRIYKESFGYAFVLARVR